MTLFLVSCTIANILIIVICNDGAIYDQSATFSKNDEIQSIVGNLNIYFVIKLVFLALRLLVIVLFLSSTVQFIMVKHKASKVSL